MYIYKQVYTVLSRAATRRESGLCIRSHVGLACTAWCTCCVYGANDARGGCRKWPQAVHPDKLTIPAYSHSNMLAVMSARMPAFSVCLCMMGSTRFNHKFPALLIAICSADVCIY